MTSPDPPPPDGERAVESLRALVRIPTVSGPDERSVDRAAFDGFLDRLAELYPLTHALAVERVAGHSLLIRWPGRESGDPAVLMAHYDVVPASDDGWRHPPFDALLTGAGDERTVWGRGALDDKGSLVALLEAVESLLAAGGRPARDVYLSFGHDEETTGSGAKAVVDLLESRGIRPSLVLDEGGAVVSGVFPGIARPLAVIGVSEKGQASLVLRVEQGGGHASTPPRTTATVRLARAVVRLNSRPFPARLGPANLAMVRALAPHAVGATGALFRRAGRLSPLLAAAFARLGDETRAIVRTTAAVTMLSGSAAPNVLAERAEAVVNLRIAVGSTVEECVRHVRRAIRDPLVTVEVRHPNEPSPVSPSSGPAWDAIVTALASVYPDAVPTPYVMLAASDSRHFARISEHVYRFSPFDMSAAERASLHAVDERIRVSTLLRGVDFYRRLLTLL